MGGGAGWGVVAVVDEPPALLAAFAAHHLALGAREVLLCLDADRPDVVSALGGHPGVALTVCDADWWAQHRPEGRPGLVVGRQRFILNHVFRGWRPDWILHCDADEFLMPEGDVGAALEAVSPEHCFATVRVAERMWRRGVAAETIFEGVLCSPALGDRTRAAGLPPGLAACVSPHGMLGHAAGKSFVRRGAAVRMGVHAPEPAGPKRAAGDLAGWRARAGTHLPGALAHFDGLTPLHWVLKLLRRFAQLADRARPGWPDRIEGLDLGPCIEERKAQIRLVHALRRDRGALVRAVEALTTTDTGSDAPSAAIMEAVRRVFPGLAGELAPAAFDAGLRARHAAMIAALEVAL